MKVSLVDIATERIMREFFSKSRNIANGNYEGLSRHEEASARRMAQDMAKSTLRREYHEDILP